MGAVFEDQNIALCALPACYQELCLSIITASLFHSTSFSPSHYPALNGMHPEQ